MEIAYSRYKRRPKRQLNRFEHKIRMGTLLRVDQQYFLDYFPWQEFGDKTVEELLEDLRSQRKLPDFLLRDLSVEKRRQEIFHKSFLNHRLNGNRAVIKLKYLGDLDQTAKSCNTSLASKIRIDFNSGPTLEGIKSFWKSLQDPQKIDYLEDPCPNGQDQWGELSALGIPLACDRECSNEKSLMYNVFKPNRDEWLELANRINIFSSYMGHELGMYHSYLHLMDKGDLALYHGIVTSEIYQEQREIFEEVLGGTDGEFKILKKAVESMYREFEDLEWISLI